MHFKIRMTVCFLLILTVMLTASVRVALIGSDEKLSQAAVEQSTRRVDVATIRGDIFDCNGVALTDVTRQAVTVVFPSSSAAVALSQILSDEDLDDAVKKIRNGQSVTVYGKAMNTKGPWYTFFVPRRYDGTATHILGYIGGDGHGVSGVEKAFDGVLFSDLKVGARYSINSLGRMLEGNGFEVFESKASGSVTLTVDSRLQALAERAMADVTCGAAVIMEAATGKLKAVVSRPDFEVGNIGAALNDPNSPLINRAVYSYNVGSVFKPCIAAAALENGLGDYRYVCKGSITVDGKTFKCHKASGHGELGLKEALAESCNTYFYTLGEHLGAEAVYGMSKLLRFGEGIDCGGGLTSSAGSMPSLNMLRLSVRELTNLSIGQGELMLSPVAVAVMYAAVVNGGEYRQPYLVQSVSDGQNTENNKPSLPTVAFSKTTADILKEYLKNVLQNGTGNAAFSDGISAGGKTGTAQTGWRDGDRSVLNGWFCGFYEGQRDYVIVVLKEDVRSGSSDCAPIFKNITEGMKSLGF